MFKVKKHEYINKTFRMPVELVKKMEIIAQDKRVSLNNLVMQCCEYALDNIDDDRNTDNVLYEEDQNICEKNRNYSKPTSPVNR